MESDTRDIRLHGCPEAAAAEPQRHPLHKKGATAHTNYATLSSEPPLARLIEHRNHVQKAKERRAAQSRRYYVTAACAFTSWICFVPLMAYFAPLPFQAQVRSTTLDSSQYTAYITSPIVNALLDTIVLNTVDFCSVWASPESNSMPTYDLETCQQSCTLPPPANDFALTGAVMTRFELDSISNTSFAASNSSAAWTRWTGSGDSSELSVYAPNTLMTNTTVIVASSQSNTTNLTFHWGWPHSDSERWTTLNWFALVWTPRRICAPPQGQQQIEQAQLRHPVLALHYTGSVCRTQPITVSVTFVPDESLVGILAIMMTVTGIISTFVCLCIVAQCCCMFRWQGGVFGKEEDALEMTYSDIR